MIRVLRSHNCGGGWNPQNMLSRYLTTARESEMNLDVENTLTKRFATPRKPRQLKPIKQPFGVGLFTGIFDKNIFKYPRILANEEIISVVQQSIELENYLNKLKPHSTNFKNILKDLNHVEMFGLTVPQKYGGLGYTETEAKFIEECSSINPLVAQMLGTNENFVAKILTLLGSEEQKLKYLPKLATGEKIFSFAYLEDGPIVDLNSLETNCVRDETTNCYIINGNKKWVPNADISDHIIVLSKELDISEETVQLIFCFCIVDKNTPGITIHKFKSGTAKDFNLCEVEFKNVRIPMDNCVGNDKENSYSVFIKTLSHNQLSASVACLAALKRILHSVVQHCENKTLNGKSLEEHSFIQGSVGYLTMYTYALESVTYFMCGMLDKFENPDLIMEANIAKALAVDLLFAGVEKYIEIIGRESCKSTGILEETLKILHYHTVLDENQIHLKLMIGSGGIINASRKSKKMRETVDVMRNPFNYPFKSIFRHSAQKGRVQELRDLLKLKMEVHESLQNEADILEECFVKLFLAVEKHLSRFGSDAVKDDNHVIKFGEMGILVYALAASLSRASSSYCNYVHNSEDEVNIVKCFASLVRSQMERYFNEVAYLTDSPGLYKYAGECALRKKDYPAEHPLARSY